MLNSRSLVTSLNINLEQQDCSDCFFILVFLVLLCLRLPQSHTQALSCCVFAVVSKVSDSYISDCLN